MPLIIGAKSASASTGVANSCRFNEPDSAYLSFTQGAPTEAKNFTISVWAKRGNMGDMGGGDYNSIISYYLAADTARGDLYFGSDDKLNFTSNPTGGSWLNIQVTDKLFRDPTAWYHIVVAVDTTAAEANRAKIWVNGTLQTLNNTIGTGDMDLGWSVNTHTMEVGRVASASQSEFDGYMSEVCFIDGTTYAASDFGEFDSDSPTIWKPKSAADVSGLTFGNNGFYLNFEDSADLGADASGNSNDLTENNLDATDQATDTPTNNFCTINPLDFAITGTAPTISQGNCLYTSSGAGAGSNNAIRSTIAVSNGKWYWESKWIQNATVWGMQNADAEPRWTDGYLFTTTGTWGIHTDGSKTVNGTQTSSVFTALSTNDIVGLAFDLDNGKFYMSVNGTFVTSGDPTSGATGTGSLGDLTSGLSYMPVICNANYDSASIAKMNFGGSPAFTVSSGNADGDGYGNFEYAVPSGYYALCTKNLGAYGG
jgi:hypothetical protein